MRSSAEIGHKKHKEEMTVKFLKNKRLIFWTTIFLAALIIPLQFSGEAHAGISYVGSSSTPVDNDGNNTQPAVVTPPSSMESGDFVLLIEAHRGGSPSISETGGQTWTEIGSASNNLRTRVAYCIFNGTWAANPSIDYGDS